MAELMRPVLLCLSLWALSGCAAWDKGIELLKRSDAAPSVTEDAKTCSVTITPEKKLKLELIEQLMGSGRLHAALAHLDAIHSQSAQERYLRAEILRRTGRGDEAIPLYRALLGGCMAGSGYHGLGLIAGREQKIDDALEYLEKARRELPTDSRVRNDYGYVLLLDGQYERAGHEFQTALELDGGDPKVSMNMLLLMLVMGHETEAQAFTTRMNLEPDVVAALRVQAESIKADRAAGEAWEAAAPLSDAPD